MTSRIAVRLVVTTLLAAATLLGLSALLTGVDVDSFRAARLARFVDGAINALSWPVGIRITPPLTVLTLGLFALALAGAVVLLVAAVSPGVSVHSPAAGVAVALGVTAVTTIGGALLSIDDDARVVRHLRRRAA